MCLSRLSAMSVLGRGRLVGVRRMLCTLVVFVLMLGLLMIDWMLNVRLNLGLTVLLLMILLRLRTLRRCGIRGKVIYDLNFVGCCGDCFGC